MRTACLVCVLALALSAAACAGALLNPGFENGFTPSGVGNHWTPYTWWGGLTFGDSTTVVHSGAHSQRISAVSGYGDGGIWQQFDTALGQTYTVSAWIYVQGAATDKAWLELDPQGSTPNPNPWFSQYKLTTKTNEWELLQIQYTALSTKSTVIIECLNSTIYVDDFQPAVPEPSSLLALASGLVCLGPVLGRKRR